MNKLVLAALLVTFACHKKKADDHSGDNIPHLPVPTKLPPAGSAKPVDEHAAAIDNEYATLMAMYKAPEGATPCESLYNAILAEQDAAKNLKRDSVFLYVAPKADFMKLCGALPLTSQQCLVPAYQAKHGPECELVQTKDDDVAKLYQLREGLEPPKEPGQMPGSAGAH